MLVFIDEPVASNSLLSSTFLKFLDVQRFIGGIAIGIFCLQWSLSASATDPDCKPIIQLPQPLVSNGSFVTQITTPEVSYFRLRCSCNASFGEVLQVTATLKIVEPKIIRNGSATISAGSSGDVEEISSGIMEAPLPDPRPSGLYEYEVDFPYSVKVSTSGEQSLEAGSYSVPVKFNIEKLICIVVGDSA